MLGLFADDGGIFLWFRFWGETRKGFAGFEGFAVLGSKAVFVDSFSVSFGAVADVFVEAVVWVFFGKVYHVMVASDFGNDRGGGNFADFGVSFDKGGSVACEWSMA